MLSVEDALARVLNQVPRMPAERVPLVAAFGRVLAEDLVSPMRVPPWDNSAMDGYAVRAADCATRDDEAVVLTVNEVVPAGSVASVTVSPGTATGIMTGAPLPDGADSVVMVERTTRVDGGVRVEGVVRPGDHVRRGGEDVGVGDVVIAAGTVLTPGQVGVAASLGLAALAVRRRPVIAILTTGDELVEPGLPLGPGQIYGSNGVALAGLVEQAGGTPRLLGNAPDDLDGMVARLEHATDADAVVTTGGVSVGDHDHVREALARLGAAIDFWKVRIKPGKPLAFGHVERGGRRVPIFGLPGNPVSCTVEFVQFVAPWVRTAMAARHPFGPVIDAVAEEAFRVRAGRVQFIRVALEHRDGRVYVRRTGEQGSGMLTSMARAHGLLVLPEHADGVAVGEPVRVQLLDTSFLHGDSPRYWREP